MDRSTPPVTPKSSADLSQPDRPEGVLRHAVDEAARLLLADGAILYMLEPDGQTLRWECDAGITSDEERAWMRSLVLPVGVGMYGKAVAERAVRITHDYPGDQSFPHAWMTDQVARGVGIRSMCVAPLLSGDEALGALGVYSARPRAFGESDAALVRALADHAAASVVNARLIEQLREARRELERRAEAEETLRAITARITAFQQPDEVLQRIVDECVRLLRADGAHLALMADTGRHLVPVVVAGSTDQQTRAWLHSMEFPVGGGINGLAALLGAPVRTTDYLTDPRIPHEEDDQAVALRLGLRGMAAAPLRGQRGDVIGTLAISYREPLEIGGDAVDLLQGMADQAAIAVTNSRLYAELHESEDRYRYLLRNSPDLVWSTDAEGHFTFLSDALEPLLGWPPEEMVGRPFLALTAGEAVPLLRDAWRAFTRPPYPDQQLAVTLKHRDGRPVAADLRAVAIVVDGVFMGGHGAARDMRAQDRLERDLRRQAAELASAQERARLARELHDSVTQVLFSMTLTTRSIEMLVDRDPDAAEQKLTELRQLEHDALAEMRALIFELRPSNLEEVGLVEALRTHAAAVQGRTGIVVTVDSDAAERPPVAIEGALYRVAQEALHNVVKHARAGNVRIAIERSAGRLAMEVTDDGQGFDPGSVRAASLGLAGMRGRIEALEGRLAIDSRLGEGTRVSADVPLPSPLG